MKLKKEAVMAAGLIGAALSVWAAAGPDAAPAPASVAEQIANGQKLYGVHCSKCHGDAGEGTKKGPAVVGKDALPLDPPKGAKLRKTQFHTAKDVADFVVAKMPGDHPATLKAEEYWAILAFDLKANGVDLKQPVDAKVASTITLHP